MTDPTLQAAHFLNAESVVNYLIQNLEIQFQVEGDSFDRDAMNHHVKKRSALIVTRGLLLDEADRILTSRDDGPELPGISQEVPQ